MTNAIKIFTKMEFENNNAQRTFCSSVLECTLMTLRDNAHWGKAVPMLVGYTVSELVVSAEWKTPNRSGVLRKRRAPVRVQLGDIANPAQVGLINSAFAEVLRETLRVVATGSTSNAVDPFKLLGLTKEGQPAFSLQLAENPLYFNLRFG